MAEKKGTTKKGSGRARTGARRTGAKTTAGDEKGKTAAAECPVSVCPIGMFLTATGEARPDVVEHLLKAGRELILAVQALVEARSDILDRRSGLEKIEVE